MLAVGASALAVREYLGKTDHTSRRGLHTAVLLIAVGCAALFAFRWWRVTGRWQPLVAHVDGLILLSWMLATSLWFLLVRPRMLGVTVCALPVLAVLLAWAICASAWTYQPFNLESLAPLWRLVHLGGVYAGLLFGVLAAASGAMFLVAQRRIRRRADPTTAPPRASLEQLEGVVIRTAALGFVLLTIALVSGVVIQTSGPTRLGAEWWLSPKVLLATAAWAVYALVINARWATVFRGAGAAWLSIAGLVLLLVVYGIVTALPEPDAVSTAMTTGGV